MSQPPTPTPLSPTDQDALVKQIGLALMRTAPDDWQQISAEFRATGRYYELSADVTDSDGSHHAWTASHDIAMHFAKLRAGMYREGRGTWFNARYQIEKPSSYNLEFDRQEPQWRTPPPPAAFRDELHFFPRTEDNVPEWLMRKLSGLPPERPGRRFRLARIFDGTAPNGRPSVNRPQVSDDDRDRLLDYLDHSALALPERGHDVDRLSTDGRPTVPVAFHTDGVWVWPAAVNYYLRRYGVPPDPELVSHARTNGFRPPEVDEATRVAAAATITGGRPPGPPRPPGPGGPPGAAGPGVGGPGGPPGAGAPNGPGGPGAPLPAGAGAPGASNGVGGPPRQSPPSGVPLPPVPATVSAMAGQGGPGGITDLSEGRTTALNPPAAAQQAPAAPQPTPMAAPEENSGGAHSVVEHSVVDRAVGDRSVVDESVEEVAEQAPPAAVPAARGGSQQERTLNLLNQRLSELRVPEHTYRIGEPAAQTWYLEQVDDGWQVGWFDGEFSSPMLFDEVADASAFLLGKLLLGVPAESALHDGPRHDAPRHETPPRGIDLPAATTEPAPIEPPVEPLPPEPVHTPALEDTQLHTPVFEPDLPGEHTIDPVDSPSLGRADDRVDMPAAVDSIEADDRIREHAHEPVNEMPNGMPGGLPNSAANDIPGGIPNGLPSGGIPNGIPTGIPNATNGMPNDRVTDRPGLDAAQQQPPPPVEWPIQPLAGEPPLTLFRGKRLLELQPGTEVDRFGTPEGNLTYVAGTPFEQRSLVPDWVHRPYHVYRVIRPLQALTGGAIPWFDQPGGGTAYLLVRAVDELLGNGDIIEVEPAEPPVN